MRRPPMSIVFMTGTDKSLLLNALMDDGFDVRFVILPARSSREERLAPVLEVARNRGIAVLRPLRAELTDALRSTGCNTLLSAGYPFLLDQEQLKVASDNINVHPTLLPKYRGAATGWHVLASGDKECGVTVHRIDIGCDTGPILAQRRVPLTPFDTLQSQTRKLNAVEPDAVREALRRVTAGERGEPQQEAQASAFHERRTGDDSRIDPSKSIQELYYFIRACDPSRFPAFFEVEGQRVGIKFFRLDRPPGEEDMI